MTGIEVQEYVAEDALRLAQACAYARGYEEGAARPFFALIAGALMGALLGVAAMLCLVHL